MRYQPIIPRFPKFLHGGDYNPDQWQKHPEILEEDLRLMDLSGCNTFSLGIFAWTALEPAEGRFEFGWLDQVMDRLADRGYNAILATPSGSKPPWMSYQYPEIRRVNREGRRDVHWMRHNHCWTSPVYREKVGIINHKLAERYASHPALAAWHLSNEYNGECFCDLCLASWHAWLERKYQTLDHLNDAWWAAFWSHTYSDWTQIDPRDTCVNGIALDWRRFITWQCCDFMRHEVAPLKQLTPDIPVTTNMMGFFEGLDYWRVAEVCDVIADDSYPCWWDPQDTSAVASWVAMNHDMHRSMKAGRPWILMESCPSATNWQQYHRLKRPGVHRREMLQAIGHGADATLYFQWRKGMGAHEKFHGAVVDHVRHENTRVFQDVAEVGAIHRKIDDVIGTTTKADVAVVYDWDSRWALEQSSGPSNGSKKVVETLNAHYRPFWEAAVSTDVIESLCPFEGYKVIVAPMLFLLKPGVAGRLRAFVEGGGTLVATYLSGIVDEYNRCWPGGWPGDGLRSLFGIWNEEFDGLTPQDKQQVRFLEGNALGVAGEFAAADYCERVHLEGAEALAVFGSDFYAGMPAVTRHPVGAGRAYYVAARTGLDCLRALTAGVLAEAGVSGVLPNLPAGVTAQRRTDGEREFLFVLNFTSSPKIVPLGACRFRDMIAGTTVEGSLDLPANGSAVLERVG